MPTDLDAPALPPALRRMLASLMAVCLARAAAW